MIGTPTPAFALKASFRWCSGSPQFQISDVPKRTVTLDLQMTELDVPSYRHGGGAVSYAGQRTIECGALNDTYRGASPPSGQVHTYEWTIKAIDSAGKSLGQTTARRKFPE
ncbi:MAG: hypothetical protein K2P80_06780 [Beijerinckiaceae bacterium]|nr:hypothetical protein [Beijerinckiaceae bacterium]